MSIAGGIYNSLVWGKEVGCNTIQIFTKSNNQWRAKPLSEEEIDRFKKNQKETQISPVVAHDSYLINVASNNKFLQEKSKEALLIEYQRCEALGIPYLVMHPGAHTGAGEKEGLKRISESLNWLFQKAENYKVQIALETTAGQGSNLGYRFEHLAEIIDKIEQHKKVCICLDTCHVFAAGYDIRVEAGYDKMMDEFNKIIGLEKLKVIHFNDSVKDLGSRVDRHEHIGRGKIGKDGFAFFMNDKRLEKIPKLLETPKDAEGKFDRENLKVLRSLVKK